MVADGTATFVQTVGGRTGVPAPRRVNHPPFVQLRAPVVWTTLKLVLRADGTAAHELVGASDFPRHWLYDADGALSAKVGLADFTEWYRHAFGKHTPWGDQESPQLVTAVETALERELAARIMRGGEAPEVRTVDEGGALTEHKVRFLRVRHAVGEGGHGFVQLAHACLGDACDHVGQS